MFSVGDRVVYPMHGAGVIRAIEEQEILGSSQSYYVMHLPMGDMKVMIPLESASDVGLREVIDPMEVDKVLEVLRGQKTKMSTNWNRRYRANLEKIRTGNIYEVAEVVRNLSVRDQEKGLSTGERKMLESARGILLSELVLAKGIDESAVEAELNAALLR
ncbi:MAG: CarD family transcriptional regulator [Firmicutes bacterium RBG_13_65_8]|nr:MAG: CarD family transcriptional regulator [Firmicutes bacterium RBG_13_65_8]